VCVKQEIGALTLVQTFDPSGVTMRSPHGYLLIQFQQVPKLDLVAIEIIEEHFEDRNLWPFAPS